MCLHMFMSLVQNAYARPVYEPLWQQVEHHHERCIPQADSDLSSKAFAVTRSLLT